MPFGYGPPPNVWWSKPLMPVPHPWLGVTDAKSSSVNTAPEQTNRSWLTKVRPSLLSVNPIGSSETWLDGSAVLSFTRVHFAGCLVKSTLFSWVYDVKNVLPVFQLLPMDGSPASSAMPLGASYCRYVGALTLAIRVGGGRSRDAVTEPV